MQEFNGMTFKPYPENKGTIVCFTGADVPDHRDVLLSMEAKACKLSYFGLTQRKFNIDDLIYDLSQFEYVVVEPGMGSVRNMMKKYPGSFNPGYFINKYYDFCHQIKDVVTVFLAYDFVTNDFTWEDIEDYVYKAQEQGLHIAPTVFPFMPPQRLIESGYLDHFDIVSMPFNEKHWNHSLVLADKVVKNGVKLHGHSISDMRKYQYLPLYSADTSAWLDGQKFGTTYRYTSGTLKSFNARDKERVRPMMYKKAEENGIDVSLLKMDNIVDRADYKRMDSAVLSEVNAFNLMEWMEFAEFRRNFEGGRNVGAEID